MTDAPSVSVIVVNYRTPEYAMKCVQSLVSERLTIPNLEVVLVDNASGDNSVSTMSDGLIDLIGDGFVTLISLDLNGGFGWANNQALLMLLGRKQPPDFVMLLNPDCIIEPSAITLLLDELLACEKCAVAGSQLLNPDGSWTGSAFRFPTIGRELVRGARIEMLGRLLCIAPTLVTSEAPCEADWVTGASCLIRTNALASGGLFDDGFFLYFEEVELMFRMRQAGWRVRHVPDSRVIHIGGASTGLSDSSSSIREFPLYWFKSRRRFFTVAYGPFRAWLAGLAWIAGTFIGRWAAAIQPSRLDPTAAGNRRRLLSYGLKSSSDDRSRSIVRVGDTTGVRPHWIRFSESEAIEK